MTSATRWEKPDAGNPRVRYGQNVNRRGHKRGLCLLATGLAGLCSAAVLQLADDTTWTDLSALEGYDGVEIASGRTLTLNPASGTTMNFVKPISGGGGIVKDGAGSLELRAENTFDGLFIIGGTGDVYAYSNGAFGSAVGRTKHYQCLYTGGNKDANSLGANLYLCGITTDEGFDLITNDKFRYLYAQSNTDNTINGSMTLSGSQASVYALSGGTVRIRGGISGSQFRPSTASNGKIIIENKPMTCGMWNAVKGEGQFWLSAPNNGCGYTWHPITLGCAWAFDGASVSWDTGGTHMKVNLNGYPNRVAGIAVSKSEMNGWVTSTGGKAFLYYKGTANVSTYLPFRGQAGLFHEGNVTTTLMKNTKNASDTAGELCVTNGTVAFDAAAGWPNVTGVTLAEKGRLTLTADGQIGTKAALDLSGDSLLTLPENGALTVAALKLNGAWLAAGDYAVAQLGGRVAGDGATVHVGFQPREGWLNVFGSETWNDAKLAELAGAKGVWIHEGVTLTLFNTAAYALNTPVAGAGTLVLDGTGRLDLDVANPEFDGALQIKGSVATGCRSVYLNDGGFLGTTGGATTVYLAQGNLTTGCEIWLPSMITSEGFAFQGKDPQGRIKSAADAVVIFNGDVTSSGSQVSYMPGVGASFVFNKSFTGGNVSLSPKANAKIVFNCPCTAGVFNSHETAGEVVFNATGNAPLGYFCCWAKFGVDFAWDNVDGVLGMAYFNNVKLDLRGHPQRVTSIAHYGSTRPHDNCSYVTDGLGAKSLLHVNSTATADSRVYFKGTAGLCWENTGKVTFKDTTSTSRGDLVVEKGRVIFDTATWLTGDTATVKDGAVLELKDVTKFAFVHLVIETGGKLVLPSEGSGTLHACDVKLGDTTHPAGTTLTASEHADFIEGSGKVACDGDYVIDVSGANADTVEEVTVNVPANVLRIVKTGNGTAYVKAGSNLSPTARIVIRAGVLGVASKADIPVLMSASTPSIEVEDGGTLDLSGMSWQDSGADGLRSAVVSIAGAGAANADGTRLGAIRRWKRTGEEQSGQGHAMLSSIILTADATVNPDGIDFGCVNGGSKVLNGHTLTKKGGNQWYMGGRVTAGNVVVQSGNFILFDNPAFEGTAENFIRVEGGTILFNNCSDTMTPVPHTLDWRSGSPFTVYNQKGRWGGPWFLNNDMGISTNAKYPDNGSIVMGGSVVATNRTITLNSSQPRLTLSGTNRHELGYLNIAGQLELRDGAQAELHPFASGALTEITIAQNVGDVAWGVPAKLTVSNATLTAAEAATAAPNVYGDFVLSWSAEKAAELNVQDGAVLTGALRCAQGGLGVVKQSGGEFVARDVSGCKTGNFIGNNLNAYGAYLMSGGRFVSDGSLGAAGSSGVTSIIRQDGGEFVSGVNGHESFDARTGYFSLYQTGGVFTNASAISFGYRASASTAGGRREIGVTGPETYHYNYWDIRVGGATEPADSTVFHVADGATVDLRCFNYARPTGTQGRRFYMGAAGGVLRPHVSGNLFANLPPDRFTLYRGGLVVDTSAAGGNVNFSAALKKPTGKVVTGVTLPTDAAYLAETNFIGPAKITIDGGAGFGATAVTTYREQGTKRSLTGVDIVSPGFGYAEGDGVTATVEGQFKKTSYACTVTLGDPDTTGGLTKRGANRLVMTGANDYAGMTRIEGGTLEFKAGAYPADSDVEITAEAANAARLSGTPTLIVADFPNGRTVTVTGAEKLSLDDLRRAVRLARFTGTLPTAVRLRLLDSNGNPYALPDGNQLYCRGGVIAVGVPSGMMMIIR